jgi:hypothetical protein
VAVPVVSPFERQWGVVDDWRGLQGVSEQSKSGALWMSSNEIESGFGTDHKNTACGILQETKTEEHETWNGNLIESGSGDVTPVTNPQEVCSLISV